MNVKLIGSSIGLFLLLWVATAFGQSAVATAAPEAQPYSAQGGPASASQGGAVSYASVTQLNGLLAQLEATSKTTQADLARLRIERWKTDNGSTKKQALSDRVESDAAQSAERSAGRRSGSCAMRRKT